MLENSLAYLVHRAYARYHAWRRKQGVAATPWG